MTITVGSAERAHEIMGSNFFGIEQGIRYFGKQLRQDQRAALREVPFTENTLRNCRASHVLVAVLPVSFPDIKAVVKPAFVEDCGGGDAVLAEGSAEPGWHLLRKTPVPDSMLKTWKEQLTLLSHDERVPSAHVITYTVIGYFLACEQRLFERVYLRSSDECSPRHRVSVGHFSADGLRLRCRWDDHRYARLGVAPEVTALTM